MIRTIFLFGVLAGMSAATLVWLGISSALVLIGFTALLLLCAFLSSAIAATMVWDGSDFDDTRD